MAPTTRSGRLIPPPAPPKTRRPRRSKPPPPFPLLSLPPELHLLISTHLPLSALSSLSQSNQYLHTLLTPELYSSCPRNLHEAARRGWVRLARHLIETLKVSVNEWDENGLHSIEYAGVAGNEEIVRLLIAAGSYVPIVAARRAKMNCWGLLAYERLRRAEQGLEDQDGPPRRPLWAFA